MKLSVFKILETLHKYPNCILPIKHWKCWQHWVRSPAQRQGAWLEQQLSACGPAQTSPAQKSFSSAPRASCLQCFPQMLSGNAKMSADLAIQLFEDCTATIYFSVRQCGIVKNLKRCLRQSQHCLSTANGFTPYFSYS